MIEVVKPSCSNREARCGFCVAAVRLLGEQAGAVVHLDDEVEVLECELDVAGIGVGQASQCPAASLTEVAESGDEEALQQVSM